MTKLFLLLYCVVLCFVVFTVFTEFSYLQDFFGIYRFFLVFTRIFWYLQYFIIIFHNIERRMVEKKGGRRERRKGRGEASPSMGGTGMKIYRAQYFVKPAYFDYVFGWICVVSSCNRLYSMI